MTSSTTRATGEPDRQHTEADPARLAPNDLALFLGQWLRSPLRIGAVAPSSRHLARAVSCPLPEQGEPVVVELGPGTGPFTAEIQRRLGGRGRHLAIELNPRLADLLRRRYPGAEVIQEDAKHLRRLLDERGIERADVVVSGLPWTLFPAADQRQLMDATTAILGPYSAFTAFTYLHAVPLSSARRFRDLLADRFEEVIPSRTVWRNWPPAFVLHARRPRS
ncbi:class I SAM-dependent methyltransferase [Nonomuraea angiospora]|uniref:class I SAM-dependent methyltransferase n=1 Tax=Nonomuraea angiospora TaxID=46172 RepID=UPI0029B5DD77|nr:methyltransferase domain-containing protein [Nonomuraea angiospora]MDX3104562.1 methyltransferase domain-containing protein [Nonomuraea angiospora]